MGEGKDQDALPLKPRVVVAIPEPNTGMGRSEARTTADLMADLERVPGLDEETRTSFSNTLSENAVVFDRWLEVNRRPSPMLALHSGPLRDGAPALLVRNPDADPDRLIVFSDLALDDRLLDRALSDFTADEFMTPDHAGCRIVAAAWEAPVFDATTSADPAWEDLARVRVGDQTLARTDVLRQRMPDLPPVDVSGIGPVRVLLTSQAWPIDWDVLLGAE